MMSSLTKDTMVRTLCGLKPLKSLKAGDKIVAFTGDSVDADAILEIVPRAVEKAAYEVKTRADTVIVGETQPINGSKISDLKIGQEIESLTGEMEIRNVGVSSCKKIAYDDITFSVKTEKYHNLFVGSNGSIFIECD